MATIEIELDEARDVMYDDLTEMLGERAVEAELQSVARDRLTQLYDNREQIQQELQSQ